MSKKHILDFTKINNAYKNARQSNTIHGRGEKAPLSMSIRARGARFDPLTGDDRLRPPKSNCTFLLLSQRAPFVSSCNVIKTAPVCKIYFRSNTPGLQCWRHFRTSSQQQYSRVFIDSGHGESISLQTVRLCCAVRLESLDSGDHRHVPFNHR